MYATDHARTMQQQIQRYSDRLRAELFTQARRHALIAFYNHPVHLAALWLRIDEANQCRLMDGILKNEYE